MSIDDDRADIPPVILGTIAAKSSVKGAIEGNESEDMG